MTQLLVVTDLPTPYRQPVFAELAQRLDLVVAYISQESSRPWPWSEQLHGHEALFLSVEEPHTALEWAHAGRNLRRLTSELRPEVVVAAGWNKPTTWVALADRRHPVAIWAESTAADAHSRRRSNELLKRAIVRAAAGIVVPGSRSADYARSLGATRVVVAPNAVDNARFAGDGPSRARSATPIVLYLGRLSPEKGLGLLPDALATLLRTTAFELEVVGDGPLRPELERRLRAAGIPCSFVGAVADTDAVADHLRRAAVLVLPSTSEPWGLVVNEAVAAGTPVVVSDVVGAAVDLVEPGVTGQVFRSGDADALADALATALGTAPGPELLAATARLADAHSPARCAEGFVQAHQQLAQRRP